jgi:hypothetical protein
MGIVEEEADESVYWMELLIDCGLIRKDNISHLLNEGDQILAMTVSSIRTAREKNNNRYFELFPVFCLLFRNPNCSYHSRDTNPLSMAKVVRAWTL